MTTFFNAMRENTGKLKIVGVITLLLVVALLLVLLAQCMSSKPVGCQPTDLEDLYDD